MLNCKKPPNSNEANLLNVAQHLEGSLQIFQLFFPLLLPLCIRRSSVKAILRQSRFHNKVLPP